MARMSGGLAGVLIAACLVLCATRGADGGILPQLRSRGEPVCACACEGELVEQLLGVVKAAAEQYDALVQRLQRLQIQNAARDAIVAVPVELWFLGGLVAAWACAALGAARARRRVAAAASAEARRLSQALQQRSEQWRSAVAEATELASLLQQQSGGGSAGAGNPQPAVAAPDQAAAAAAPDCAAEPGATADAAEGDRDIDVAARAGRDTGSGKSSDKPAKPSDAPATDAAAPRDGSAARRADPRAGPAAAAGDDAPPRKLRFEEPGAADEDTPSAGCAAAGGAGADEARLHVLLEEFNRALEARGLSHRRLALAPAPAPEAAPAAPEAASAEEVRRLRDRIGQLESQAAAASASASAQAQPTALVAVPQGSLYVTHREMELAHENAALKQQLQAAAALPPPGGDGWVTTTRGGGGADGGGALDPAHELWVPAGGLAGPWGFTPAGKSAAGSILGGALTPPPRGSALGSGCGSARATPGSEGSVKTAHGSGGRGAAARSGPPALRGAGSVAASAGGSPSKGSSGGTPRERMAAALQDSRARIEQLALNLNAIPLKAQPPSATAPSFGSAAQQEEDWGV
ncbi:hypothetical protein Rsub_04034 [Raphidocelis subcapitata]|uniref:Uncharacterized protein n=1 Tax=Raphidocelis subcapitata TaxID=307507 RepID=A0A2V0P1L8_9CHLO|nr:hypothetical protein Rsub_04034 [Raphidocelis subcapitata]|eukprot:GBF91730.1 hypothetical protein Rsub_04034 [Raphidocelis subcapitata]